MTLPPRTRRAIDSGWSFRRAGDADWLPATVPGCNFTDLWRAGVIEDPYVGDAEDRLQWIEGADWEYRCLFHVDAGELAAGSVELAFDGLDTFCSVSLNGAPLLDADNMFREWRAEAKPLLRAGENELLLRFRSPVVHGTERQAADGFFYPAENDKTEARASAYARKAPYHFGWDWGPKYVTSGVWRPVWLDMTSQARIRDVNWRIGALDDARASVTFTVEIEALAGGEALIDLACAVPGVPPVRREITLHAGLNTFDVTVAIDTPRRWWPNGLGEAFLYRFTIALTDHDGAAIDSAERRVGLRTIRLVNEPDELGESFHVEVNGRPVFMKGANYIPPDSFLDRVTPDHYRQIFRDTVDANMNMLRVWGGGVYECPLFYDLADEHGVLIWQDFMFSCTLYPSDAAFLAAVTAEAEQVIRQLRHHACIALWCGNNEVSLGIEWWDWPEKFGYSPEAYAALVAGNAAIFDGVLREAVARHDPGRFYVASSPIGFWNDPEQDGKGDSHYWGVWHGELPFTTYAERIPRFMSEFGFQSYPILSSIERFVPSGERHVGSPSLLAHQKHPRGDAIISRFMQDHYGPPADFAAFCYLSQLLQADGLKIAFEAHRRNMPRCMGSLYWQLNDCWPAISWSSIDYYGQWKALHYQAARSFAPLLISVEEAPDALLFHLVSDLAETCDAVLAVELMTTEGAMVFSETAPVLLAANASAVAQRVGRDRLARAGQAEMLVCHSRLIGADGAILARDVRLLGDAGRPSLPSPDLSLESIDGRAVTVRAKRFARGVHLSAQAAGEGVVNFADNFFDMLPGEVRTIGVRGGGAFDPATLAVSSLFGAVTDPGKVSEREGRVAAE